MQRKAQNVGYDFLQHVRQENYSDTETCSERSNKCKNHYQNYVCITSDHPKMLGD